MSITMANIVTIVGVILMLVIAGLPPIWNIGVLGLTLGTCYGLSVDNK